MPGRPEFNRPVPAWRLFTRMGGWIAIILAGITVVMTLVSTSSLNLAERFDAEGQEARATVVSKRMVETRDSDGDRETHYYLQLHYTIRDGSKIELDRKVSYTLFDDHNEGQVLTIWYLPDEPRRTELFRGQYKKDAVVTQTISGITGIAALVALWITGRWTVAALRARRYGQVLEAVVTGVNTTNIKINKRTQHRLAWRLPDGATGQSLLYNREALGDITVGDRILVYQGLKQSWWEGDVGPARPR